MKLQSILYAASAVTLAATGAMSAQAQNQMQPMAQDHAMQNPAMKSPDKMLHAPLAKGKTSFTMGEAKARLEKAGYSHVTDLKKDPDGLWQARVMHRGKWVNAALDYKGNVAAR